MITAEMLVKDAVEAFPATQEVFAAHGLDLCCGGLHPIAVAAKAHGVDLGRLLDELNAAVERGGS